jgi:CHAT domain-containing protein
VLASLWDVNDESTGEMMSDFYRRWTETKGMTKSEALREAQLALLHGQSAAAQSIGKSAEAQGGRGFPQKTASPAASTANEPAYSHPYYWAPFILMGNWQ